MDSADHLGNGRVIGYTEWSYESGKVPRLLGGGGQRPAFGVAMIASGCFKLKSGESIFQCGSEDQSGIREHEIRIT